MSGPQMMQLYNWSSKTETIQTQYGKLAYVEWLYKEAARIERGPGRTARVVERGRQACLLVNRLAD